MDVYQLTLKIMKTLIRLRLMVMLILSRERKLRRRYQSQPRASGKSPQRSTRIKPAFWGEPVKYLSYYQMLNKQSKVSDLIPL